MISPLDDVINACSQESSHLQIIRRNARRLLKLINALLQVSHYREINIAKFTQELGSEFKSMAKTLPVGLDYNIDIPNPEEFNHAIGDKIYLDCDMYETIVLNLCKHFPKNRISSLSLYCPNLNALLIWE
ncbi:hypothetical protein C2G38_2172544 [Gigaspora rosea]|uniref:Uncharacterized protein n=1 Tax=Gigaspora rosea TaxID=44941 RepID=A0A397VM95_9GLOM|nr:hypothetical protein C2G38_2172544 [Gigaspora rosea]